MNYTVDHIRKAYTAGQRNMAFSELLTYFRIETKFAAPATNPSTVPASKPEPNDAQQASGNAGKGVEARKKIVEFVASKGPAGASIADIAKATGYSHSKVSFYIYKHASKMKGLQSAGRGVYIYAGK